MKQIEYIEANADVPRQVVTSTARRGPKWFESGLEAGDVIELAITETGKVFSRAVVVEIEMGPLWEVLENAHHNHVGHLAPEGHAPYLLLGELTAAYGSVNLDEPFTVIHILRLEES